MIKIVKGPTPLSERELDKYEKRDFTLISVNTYMVSEDCRGANPQLLNTPYWVYHFRVAKPSGPKNLPSSYSRAKRARRESKNA